MIKTLSNLPGNAYLIVITVPWDNIKTTYERIFTRIANEIEVSGFRKGKAPKELAAKQVSPQAVFEEVAKDIIPEIYEDAIKEYDLHPIISPHISLLEAQENKDWKISITTCNKPTLTIGDYHKAITELKRSKQQGIWTPDKKNEEKKDEESKITIDELFTALSGVIQVELAEVLIETELNRSLSRMYEELGKLGLSLEQYLSAQGKTATLLREEERSKIIRNLTLEFALEDIADREKVTVEQSEIEAIIAKAKTQEEKASLEHDHYYLSTILRRQKTINTLLKDSVIQA